MGNTRLQLDWQGYIHLHACTRPHARTHRLISNTYLFSTPTMIRERASMLRYTCIACLVSFIPVHAWNGRYESRRLRLPELLDNRHMKVVRLSALHTGRLYTREDTWNSFLLEADSTTVWLEELSQWPHRESNL
jgi:hypothetical protein